jgi:hypothetical protein
MGSKRCQKLRNGFCGELGHLRKEEEEKKETANGVRAGYTGASSTPGFTAPTV